LITVVGADGLPRSLERDGATRLGCPADGATPAESGQRRAWLPEPRTLEWTTTVVGDAAGTRRVDGLSALIESCAPVEGRVAAKELDVCEASVRAVSANAETNTAQCLDPHMDRTTYPSCTKTC
jgi:hypothetical protein